MLYELLFPIWKSFQFITFRAAGAAMAAFALTLLLGAWLIAFLSKLKVRERAEKTHSEQLSELHKGKRGTPTMGGLFFIPAVLLAVFLMARLDNVYILLCVFVTVSMSLVGFADDYIKLTDPKRHGMRISTKLFCQAIIGLFVGVALFWYFKQQEPEGFNLPALRHAPSVTGVEEPEKCGDCGQALGPERESSEVRVVPLSLYVPIAKKYIHLGWLFPLFVMLVIVASSNAVNLTDGLDGLAVGCTIIAVLAYAVICYVVGRVDFARHLELAYIPEAGEVTIVCAAMAGACMSFLWFNSFPASVFMGNMGALPLGALLGTIAVIAKQELLLFVVGAIFVVETVSVALQIFSFRVWGKRIFRIAPLHHHFQFKGWSETKVTVRFW
ncbi:MAG: phospho-N-acetylmuramoyl-pentapeptide-transferase, partial [Planctomycetota bacterium]|nr:phospho-N-acetylmuramoyl-pentapeptide-transferase [Planctomycetota bacterium]